MKFVSLAAAAACVLSACSTTAPIPITTQTFLDSRTSDLEGLEAYDAQLEEVQTEEMRFAVQSIPVRTYAVPDTEDPKRFEVGGVKCSAQTDHFEVEEFLTPTNLRVPTFGPDTRPLSVSCATEDEAETQLVQPFNFTRAQTNRSIAAGAASAGLVGLVAGAVIGGVAAAVNKTENDVFSYPPIEVELPEADLDLAGLVRAE